MGKLILGLSVLFTLNSPAQAKIWNLVKVTCNGMTYHPGQVETQVTETLNFKTKEVKGEVNATYTGTGNLTCPVTYSGSIEILNGVIAKAIFKSSSCRDDLDNRFFIESYLHIYTYSISTESLVLSRESTLDDINNGCLDAKTIRYHYN